MLQRLRTLLVAIALLAAAVPSAAASATARIIDVGWLSERGATKFVLALDGVPQHHVWSSGNRIIIDLWPATLRGRPYVTWAGLGPLGRVRFEQPLGTMARVVVELRAAARYKVFHNTVTGKLALVLVPPWMGAVPVPRSVAYQRLRVPTGRGATTAHVLLVNSRDPDLEVRPVLAGQRVRGTEPTSIMAHRHEAVAAVNGGFFHGAFPLGLVVLDGEVVTAPLERRSVLAMTDEGAVIRDFAFGGWVSPASGEVRRIAALNAPPGPGAIGAYTDVYGPWVPPRAGRFSVVIVGGRVVAHATGGTMIPRGGVVLSVPASLDAWAARNLKPGQGGTVRWSLSPDLPVRWAIGGGPRLVKEGRVFVPYHWEAFRTSIYASRAPRTAVGVTRSNKLLFVTVDGRSTRDTGMTLRELGSLMVRLGARDAMNLDGGGSATMVVGGRVVNAPSDGGERGVASAIVILRSERPLAAQP